MLLIFFIIIGALALGSIIYGFGMQNPFAFALGAVGLIIFSALLLTGVEIENGIKENPSGSDQYEVTYETLTPATDFTLLTLFYFALGLGIFALGFLIMDLFILQGSE